MTGHYNTFVEEYKLVDTIDPVSSSGANAGSWVSGYMASGFALVLVGAIAATGTVDITLTQATSAAGAGAKAFKAATQLTDADDNSKVIFRWRAEELDVDGGFNYLLLTITCATAASVVAGVLYLGDNRFNPVILTPYEEIVD